MINRDKLAKLLELLASDQPGEVTAAASLATKLLREHNMTWTDLVGGTSPPKQARTRQDLAFETLERDYPDVAEWVLAFRETNRFAASLYENLATYGRLTPRQIEAVRRNL